MTDQRLKRIALITISALIFAALIGYLQVHLKNPSVTGVVAENFGGPFTLTDHTGKTVTEKDFAGTWRLIYFGFTYCPAICPTELAKITKALSLLGDKANTITPLFITVDPERDTVDSMAKYISLFDKRLIGLTGTPEQIKQAATVYKIYYAKAKDPDMTEYTMDHSSYIYFIDPHENLLAVYRTNDTAEKMATEIAAHMATQP